MTKDEIIKLAHQVGFPLAHPEWQKAVEEFAALCEEAGRTAEKQECKRVCELEINRLSAIGEHRAALAVGICAATIDARGKL